MCIIEGEGIKVNSYLTASCAQMQICMTIDNAIVYITTEENGKVFSSVSSWGPEADLRGGHGGNDPPPPNSERVKKNMNVLKKFIEFIFKSMCIRSSMRPATVTVR